MKGTYMAAILAPRDITRLKGLGLEFRKVLAAGQFGTAVLTSSVKHGLCVSKVLPAGVGWHAFDQERALLQAAHAACERVKWDQQEVPVPNLLPEHTAYSWHPKTSHVLTVRALSEHAMDWFEALNTFEFDRAERETVWGVVESVVDVLHAANIVHLDIKPLNVIVDVATMRVQLIDFGLACSGEACLREGVCFGGTKAFMPWSGSECPIRDIPTPSNTEVQWYGKLRDRFALKRSKAWSPP
jgi:hypothetical protein